ncbi:hypothetical protein BLGI_5071 [Brevibacillus laterosporus GI-9]|nr:hypothetical protein BLGI_5071 [Brevibacillus laterosporus GI-9]
MIGRTFREMRLFIRISYLGKYRVTKTVGAGKYGRAGKKIRGSKSNHLPLSMINSASVM